MRGFRKTLSVVLAIALVVCSITVYNKTTKAADYSALTFTEVEGTDIAVAAGGDEFGFQAIVMFDDGRLQIIPNIASGTKPIWPDFSNATWNGGDATAVYGNGAALYVPTSVMTQDAYNVFEANSAVDGHTFQIIVRKGTPSDSGEVDSSEDDSSEASETTTTAVQLPGKVVGLVANINDLKTNYTIAFANVTGAKSYNLYVNGELVSAITNGGVKTIEELGLVAGTTYDFQVAAVNDAGEGEKSDVVKVTPPAVEEETTPTPEETSDEGETDAPFDPSTITEWTDVLNSANIDYYIADGKADKVTVKPQVEGGSNIYIAYSLAATFKEVTLDGVVQEIQAGAFHRVQLTDLTAGYHTLVVTDHYGNETVTIYFKVDEEEETTTPAPVEDGAEILKNTAFDGADNWNQQMNNVVNNADGSVDFEVEEKTAGDAWSSQLVQNGVSLDNGKWYVAKYTVTSDVDKNFRLLIQSDGAAGGDWSEFAALVTSVKAGQTVDVTLKFQTTKAANANALFGIMMGYIDGTAADAAKIKISNVSLTGYTNEPNVTTGSVVVGEAEVTKYSVTVDGTEVAQVEEGATYTLGDATNGYICGDVAYKAGTEVTVNADMAFTTIGDVSVTAAQGAGIRYEGSAGIRFQATVTASDAVLASTAVTTGMIITAEDIYNLNGELTLEAIADKNEYAAINVVNSGWFAGQVGTYCGSITNIAESNYIRNFVARAYVTITYADGTTTTVYSNMTGARSIKGVATAVQAAGYAGIDAAYHSVIDAYAAAK